MKVTENLEKAASLLKEGVARNQGVRDMEYIHVSELLHCLKRAYLERTIRVPEKEESRENLTTMLGRAFHAWLEKGEEHPILWNGMIGTPDRVDDDVWIGPSRPETTSIIKYQGPYPVEFKSTRSSAKKKPPEDLTNYIDQVATYCLMLGTNRAQLAILHMMGDYAQNRAPIWIVYDFEFSEVELLAWEREILRRKDLLEESLRIGVAPPAEERMKKELCCNYCPFYKSVCDGGRTNRWEANFHSDPDLSTESGW
jgi:hypothetical protein